MPVNTVNETMKTPKKELNKSVNQRFINLDSALEKLLCKLKDIPDRNLNATYDPAKWSVLQVCHHLMWTEKTSHLYLKKKLSFNPTLKKATMATKLRLKLLKSYLNTPMKFKAPEMAGDANFPAKSTYAVVALNWRKQRQELKRFLSELPEDMFEKEIYKHPFAGKLCLEGMLVFFEEHFKRHEKQINKTLKRVS